MYHLLIILSVNITKTVVRFAVSLNIFGCQNLGIGGGHYYHVVSGSKNVTKYLKFTVYPLGKLKNGSPEDSPVLIPGTYKFYLHGWGK